MQRAVAAAGVCAALALASPALAQPVRATGVAAACVEAHETATALVDAHKLRAAAATLARCAADGCPNEVRSECARRIEDVERAVPTLVFEVVDAAGMETTAVRVSIDGELLVDRLGGSAIPVDPGEHAFVFEVAGQPPLARSIVVHEGDKARHERVSFGSAPSLVESRAVGPPPSPHESGSGARRTLGFLVGGAGIAALGVAAYYQVTAVGRSNDSNAAASSSDPGVQANAGPIHDQAAQAQTYAVIAASAGAVAIGTGLVLVLTSGSTPEPRSAGWRIAPEVGLCRAGLAAAATW